MLFSRVVATVLVCSSFHLMYLTVRSFVPTTSQHNVEYCVGETISLVYDYVIRIHHSHVVFVDSFVTIDVDDNPVAALAFWYAVSGRAEI